MFAFYDIIFNQPFLTEGGQTVLFFKTKEAL
jgi:hypothetical protein